MGFTNEKNITLGTLGHHFVVKPPFSTTQDTGNLKYHVGKTIAKIIDHPPVIAIFGGGIKHSQSWVVYGIVLTTLFPLKPPFSKGFPWIFPH